MTLLEMILCPFAAMGVRFVGAVIVAYRRECQLDREVSDVERRWMELWR